MALNAVSVGFVDTRCALLPLWALPKLREKFWFCTDAYDSARFRCLPSSASLGLAAKRYLFGSTLPSSLQS
jgi:hypothetical protein